MAESKDLLQELWSGADVLRGKMDANEYKDYKPNEKQIITHIGCVPSIGCNACPVHEIQ